MPYSASHRWQLLPVRCRSRSKMGSTWMSSGSGSRAPSRVATRSPGCWVAAAWLSSSWRRTSCWSGEVAIKVLPPDLTRDAQLVARFQQEAKTAAKLDHPNIIPIYRVESEGGPGLHRHEIRVRVSRWKSLLAKGPLPIERVRHVLREAALALGHAHRRRIVHRDVKPANIMLDEDGRVILTDFGISKAVQDTAQLTGTGTIIGHPALHGSGAGPGPGGRRAGRPVCAGHRRVTGCSPESCPSTGRLTASCTSRSSSRRRRCSIGVPIRRQTSAWHWIGPLPRMPAPGSGRWRSSPPP